MQVDFTGLAIIRPHGTSQNSVCQRTPKVSIALTSLDQRGRGEGANAPRHRDEFAQQLLQIDDLLRPGWASPHRP